MLCTETETVREPDHHGGKDHGGGNRRSPVIGVFLLVACLYPFRPAIPNPEQFAMSDKETTRNETPWRARGFKKPFNGTKSFLYQEFIDSNKSNVLKLNLRQRELQCGKYVTKSDDMTAASAVVREPQPRTGPRGGYKASTCEIAESAGAEMRELQPAGHHLSAVCVGPYRHPLFGPSAIEFTTEGWAESS